jgi:hypothetical protein
MIANSSFLSNDRKTRHSSTQTAMTPLYIADIRTASEDSDSAPNTLSTAFLKPSRYFSNNLSCSERGEANDEIKKRLRGCIPSHKK